MDCSLGTSHFAKIEHMFEDTPVAASSSTPPPVDPRRLTPAARVALAVRYARELATLEARNLELLAAIADKDNASLHLAGRVIENPASDELAAELHISARAATNCLRRADTVSRFLPGTFTEHPAGELSSTKVRIVAEELPPEWQTQEASPCQLRQLLEEMVLPRAPKQTPHEFRRSVRRAIARIDTGLSNETARASRRDRGVSLFELAHGIAILEATLTVEEGRKAFDLLTRNARVEADFLRTPFAGSAGAAQSSSGASPGGPHLRHEESPRWTSRWIHFALTCCWRLSPTAVP